MSWHQRDRNRDRSRDRSGNGLLNQEWAEDILKNCLLFMFQINPVNKVSTTWSTVSRLLSKHLCLEWFTLSENMNHVVLNCQSLNLCVLFLDQTMVLCGPGWDPKKARWSCRHLPSWDKKTTSQIFVLHTRGKTVSFLSRKEKTEVRETGWGLHLKKIYSTDGEIYQSFSFFFFPLSLFIKWTAPSETMLQMYQS